MSIPFEPVALREQLRPLDFQRAQLTTAHEQTYFGYYGIDLENQLTGVRHNFGYIDVTCSDGAHFRIAVHIFWPALFSPKGTVFLVHGYYDHCGLYRHPIRYALARGYAVVAHDLPGHGLSSGPRVSIDDFSHYRDVLHTLLQHCQRHALPKPWHIMGQSTGAAIIVDYLLAEGFDEGNCPFQSIVLLAPLVRPVKWQKAKWMLRFLRPFVQQIERERSHSSSDPEFIQFLHELDPLQDNILPVPWVSALARWIPLIEQHPQQSPLSPLIIQGQQDQTVDWQHNIPILQEKFRQPQVFYLPEGRHHLVNEREALRELWLAELGERLG